MNPYKLREIYKYLTRAKKADPELPNVFPASKAPIPPVREDVETMDAINSFIRRERQQKAGGGMLVQPGFSGVRQGYRESKGIGKGSPGIAKDYEVDRSQLYTEETKAKKTKTNKLKFQSTPVGERLQWIANNGKNYSDPETFIKAYEKHFKHKIGSKKDVLFNTSGKKPLTQVDNLINTGRDAQDLFTLKKGFNEEEIFKASIIQNNPEIKKEFKTLFKDIYKNVSVYSELGPESIVEKLNKGKLLNDFDFIKSTVIGNREIGGVHSGITRNSLLSAARIPAEHLASYQSVRKPLMAVSQIIQNLKNPSFAKDFRISATTATKIIGQLENFLQGEKNLTADIKKINNQLGDVKFNNIFGGVNFEHTLAKQFGKDYKYLPRNYLLKGQFTTKAFNFFKRDAFDLPLIRLMKQYEKGEVTGAQVQKFIDDFNAKTNNYADFNFDVNKGRLAYSDNAVKYDLSRYTDPKIARQELIKNIDLTMSSEFQKGFKNLPEARDQLKLFKSNEAKNIRNLLAKIGCPGLASGGRAGFDVGTNCQMKGANLINSGMRNVSSAQLKNFAAFANRTASLGRNVMKFGVIPEAIFVAADSAIRMGMGDNLNEAFLRASDYLRPGDQAKQAEMLEADRFFGPEVAGIIGRSIDYKNQLANVQSLEDQKANLENLSGGGVFDYVGDTSQDVKNIDTQLKQATNNLNNKFKMTDAEQIYADRMQEEVDDARSSGSFFTKLKSKFRDLDQDQSDIETLGMPEQTQKQLNEKLLPTLLDAKDIMQYTTQDAINLAQAYRAQGSNVSAKDVLAYRDSLKNSSLSELAQQFNPESVYGASGTMGEPINKPVFKKPQNVIGDMEKEIVGQTNVANPFDLDISDIGTGLRGFSAAEGGVASGPPPVRGPNPQGLPGLLKRGIKI